METTPNANDKVIDRVRKLMALANNKGATEAEAQNAAAMAQRILQDNGLSMAQIERAGKAAQAEEMGGKREKKNTDRRAMYRWQRELMEALAKNNFCLALEDVIERFDGRKMRKSKTYILIGREINVITTTIMYDYLSQTVRRLATTEGYDHAGNERDHHIFLEGATSRIIERLDDQRAEREAEDERRAKEEKARTQHPSAAPSSGGALIVLSDVYGSETDLNNDHRYGLEPGTTAQRRRDEEAEAERWRKQQAEIRARRDEMYEKLIKGGMDEDVAMHMAYNGMTEERAREYVAEAEEERKKAAKRAQRQSYRPRSGGSYRGPSQAEMREQERRNSQAYRDGYKKGDAVSLNQQIDEQKKGRLS